MVCFHLHILPVHLHQSVSWSQPGHLSRGAGLHFADKLSAFVPLTVQVKSISALTFGQETEPGSELVLHPSASIDGKRANVSQESKQAFAPGTMENPWLLIHVGRFRDRAIKIII